MPSRHVHLAPISTVLVLMALVATACGGDGGTAPGPKATRLILATEPSATAETMEPLGIQPVVQAADESGQSARTTVAVSAQVLSGNGVVAAGGSVTTDAGGRATFSNLTLGGVNGLVGPLTIQFSAPGLTPVTIAVELRCAVLPLVMGQTASHALTTGHCKGGSGAYLNFFELMTSQPVTALRLTLRGLDRAFLVVGGPNEPSNNYWGFWSNEDSISFTALVPTGRNRVIATTVDAGRAATYSLTVATGSADITCEDLPPLAVSPITTAQQLGADDCYVGAWLTDEMIVGLPPNAGVTVSMASDAFEPHIELIDAFTGSTVAIETGAGGTASLTFENGSSTATPYYLDLSSEADGATGAYTVSINITYASFNGAVAAAAAVPVPQLSRARVGVMRRGSARSGMAGLLSPMVPRP
jgi:hypothetical protein